MCSRPMPFRPPARPLHLSRPAPPFVSRGLKDAPAALPRAFTNPGNTPLGLAGLDQWAGLAPLRRRPALHPPQTRRGPLQSRDRPRDHAKAEKRPRHLWGAGGGGAGSGPRSSRSSALIIPCCDRTYV
jgi:hypothetical protein